MEAVARAVGTMILPRSGTGPGKWMGALFTHTHTREGDPHLHSHLILPNVTQNREGQWRAMQVNIAGINRTRLEMVYGHELARNLRRAGMESELVMRPNGLPEMRSFRKLALRFSRARSAVLSAAKAADAEQLVKETKARVSDGSELHSRSRLPVPEDRAAMRRRQRLADQIRKPKAKDADNPMRLTDEAARWMRALLNHESRSVLRLLDELDVTNPRRKIRVHAAMPPTAVAIVRAAYQLLPYDLKPTAPLLMRASVQQSAGRHTYEELRLECNASLKRRWVANQALIGQLLAETEAIAIAAAEPEFVPLPGPRVVSDQPATAPTVTTTKPSIQAAPITPARSGRSSARR